MTADKLKSFKHRFIVVYLIQLFLFTLFCIEIMRPLFKGLMLISDESAASFHFPGGGRFIGVQLYQKRKTFVDITKLQGTGKMHVLSIYNGISLLSRGSAQRIFIL